MSLAHPASVHEPRSPRRRAAWIELCLPCCVACCLAWARPALAERTAFYYGKGVPRDLIAAYDRVVVEPDHQTDLSAFAGQAAEPIAYSSIGEVARSSSLARSVDPAWVLSENRAWSSLVMDLENPAYQAWVAQRFEELWARGYRGFFLDTLDSYRLAPAKHREAGLRQGLIEIIQSLARRHPDAQLLANRGFEVLAELKGVLRGVVAESLFDRYDGATQSYRRVPEADRRWLIDELTRVRDQLGLPVTVIDYRPDAERPQARDTARRIAALGFEPWVTNGALDGVGVGALEILPRRVLILTDDSGDGVPDAMRFLAPVLEYLGYVPEHRRPPANWAELTLEQGYQGVITWFTGTRLPPGYDEWLSAQRRRGTRFVLFGVPGFDVEGPVGRELGLSVVAPASTRAVKVVERDALIGFEAAPPSRPFDGPLLGLRDGPGTTVHLGLENDSGQAGVAVATTPWGGFALSHVLALRGLEGERAWVIDPFAFLRRALSLPDVPMPTVTTQNGRRLAMLLVRPEGLAALAGHAQPPSARALGEWLRANHAWPHSLATSPSDPATKVSAADAAAAQGLLDLPFFERAELAPGSTLARGATASLTQVSGLAPGGTLVGPVALDALFLSGADARAYPYRDVLSTFEYTEAPRRLKPVLLDYHGYLLTSPGGRATLGALYAALEREPLYPVFVSEYAELAHAFGEQVVARALDGSFQYFGGDRLRTVRSPLALGWPLTIGRAGVVAVNPGPDGLYASFLPEGPRHLALGGARLNTPYLLQTNGRVLEFETLPPRTLPAPTELGAEPDSEIELLQLELIGHMPLELELAGLPPSSACELRFDEGRARGQSSEQGALRLALGVTTTGLARLACQQRTDNH